MNILKKKIRFFSEEDVYPGMFDLPKGLFMLCVMFVHAFVRYGLLDRLHQSSLAGKIAYFVFLFFYNGCSPWLFLVCGYGWRKRSIKKSLKSQFSWLWKPYVFVALGVTACAVLICFIARGNLLSYLYRFSFPYLLALCPSCMDASAAQIGTIGPIWCMVTYLFAAIFFNAVLQKKEEWARLVLVLLLMSCGILTRNWILPFCLQQSLVAVGFLYVGWKIKKENYLTRGIPLYLILLAVPLSFAICCLGVVDFSYHVWGYGFVSLLGCLVPACIIFAITLKLNRLKGWIVEKIRWIGRNILEVCCAHTVTWILLDLLNVFPISLYNVRIAYAFPITFVYYLVSACVIACLGNHLRKRFSK